MRRTRHLLIPFVAAALVAGACGGDDDDDGSAATDASGSTAAPGATAATSGPATTGGGGGGATGETLRIGTSLPLTGPLGAFGPIIQAGYDKAVAEVNEAGGLVVGDTTHQVELIVRDNKSDGNEAAAQARDLVLGEDVVALLGAVTPPLTIPISVAAEQNQVPLVSTVTPIRAWLGANEEGWNYAFDMFFDELQMTDLQYQTADLVETNKKVAIFTDLEEDGLVMGGLWEEKAEPFGYEIVAHPEFPVGTTNFSSQVAEAKDAEAEIVIAQITPPDAIALVKQMQADSYQPKLLFIEKGANFGGWPAASEGLGEGVMAANWFAEGEGTPREDEFIEEFTPMTGGANSDLGVIVFAYTAAKVLFDAITAAGSTEADAIVTALEATNGEYPAGTVDFADDHSAGLPAIMTQWRGNDMVYVTTAEGEAGPEEIVTPVPGLG
jgi:branched-chain amino acid transport system substrate-binding protein